MEVFSMRLQTIPLYIGLFANWLSQVVAGMGFSRLVSNEDRQKITYWTLCLGFGGALFILTGILNKKLLGTKKIRPLRLSTTLSLSLLFVAGGVYNDRHSSGYLFCLLTVGVFIATSAVVMWTGIQETLSRPKQA